MPDGCFLDESYQDIVQVGEPGPKHYPAGTHKIVYTYLTISDLFKQSEVNLLEYCGEDGTLYQQYWDGADEFIFRSKKYKP